MTRTSAHVMARSVGVDPKAFREALTAQKFAWHADGADWSVETDSPEHQTMIGVLRPLFAATAKPVKKARVRSRKVKALKAAAAAQD